MKLYTGVVQNLRICMKKIIQVLNISKKIIFEI